MIRCGFHRANLRLITRSTHFIRPSRFASRCAPPIWVRWQTTVSGKGKPQDHSRSLTRYRVFTRIPRPATGDVAAWVALLDQALPAHLRKQPQSEGGTEQPLDTREVAEVLLAAQRQITSAHGIDLLYVIGFEEGRWRAVVWLVKRLTDAFGPQVLKKSLLSRAVNTIPEQTEQTPLDELVRAPIARPAINRDAGRAGPREIASFERLDDLTDTMQPGRYHDTVSVPREALGQIWRSLGRMTIACADGEIKPEVLEIIAFLHHRELMPMSIYQSKPSSDATQIQQPPMLNLFANRILTSLSDAAWRAHAKLVIDEARSDGKNPENSRPEILGAAYRVRIAGLRPEVWLELILWASLHGGWVHEGLEILQDIRREPEARLWKAYSWRSMLSGQEQAEAEWDTLEHSFNQFSSTEGVDPNSKDKIRRTISSEVVNAYIDALPSLVRVGVGQRGLPPGQVVGYMLKLRVFLQRSGLTLSAGSWDAIILRFIDAHESVVGRIRQMEELAGLAPLIGDELNARKTQDLPSYVFDGNAFAIGLLHQALRSRIAVGDMEGSIRLLRFLQARVDRNKHQSLLDLFTRLRTGAGHNGKPDNQLFTSNFAGIEYPAFEAQVPSTILGPLLELVMDVDANEIGTWLLYNKDIDGPMIPRSSYSDPTLTPSLIRFATETSDQGLLSAIVRPGRTDPASGSEEMPIHVLQNFLNSQINLKRWDTVVRLLDHLLHTGKESWKIHNLANITRVMLRAVPRAEAGDADSLANLRRATEIFKDMVQGRYELRQERGLIRHKITVFLAVLASADASWARFCLALQPLKGSHSFGLISNHIFDTILQGIVGAYGSARGRRVIDAFWPSRAQRKLLQANRDFRLEPGERTMPRMRPSPLDEEDRQRLVVKFPEHPTEEVVIFRGLQPNMLTFRIILESALREFPRQRRRRRTSRSERSAPLKNSYDGAHDADSQSAPLDSKAASGSSEDGNGKDDKKGFQEDIPAIESIAWSVRCLRSMDMREVDVRALVEKRLSPADIVALKGEKPELFSSEQWMESRENEGEQNMDADQEFRESASAGFVPFGKVNR